MEFSFKTNYFLHFNIIVVVLGLVPFHFVSGLIYIYLGNLGCVVRHLALMMFAEGTHSSEILLNVRCHMYIWCWSRGDCVLVKWRQCYFCSLNVFTCTSISTNVSKRKELRSNPPTAFIVESVYGLQLCTK